MLVPIKHRKKSQFAHPLWHQTGVTKWKVVCPYYAAESVCAHHGQLPRDCSVGSDIHDLLIQQEQSGHIVVEDYSFLFFRLFNQRLSESYFSLYMLLWGIVGLFSMTELSRVDPRIICQEKKKQVKLLREWFNLVDSRYRCLYIWRRRRMAKRNSLSSKWYRIRNRFLNVALEIVIESCSHKICIKANKIPKHTEQKYSQKRVKIKTAARHLEGSRPQIRLPFLVIATDLGNRHGNRSNFGIPD